MPKSSAGKTLSAARKNKAPAEKPQTPSSQPREHRGNRYGRSEAARKAVLEAADNLLVEIGFAAVTIEGIAARAGVGKQTIYRWWPSKTDVLMDAFLDDAVQALTPEDTGDLGRDLRSHLGKLAEFLTRSDAGSVFRALIGQAQHDPAMATQFRKDHLARQREVDRLPLRRALERGQLPADTDIDRALDQLVGPIYYRALVSGAATSRQFIDELVADFLLRKKAKTSPRLRE